MIEDFAAKKLQGCAPWPNLPSQDIDLSFLIGSITALAVCSGEHLDQFSGGRERAVCEERQGIRNLQCPLLPL